MIQVSMFDHAKHTKRARLIRWSVKLEGKAFFLDSIVPLSGESITILSPDSDTLVRVARELNLNPFKVEREVLRQMCRESEAIRRFFSWGDPT